MSTRMRAIAGFSLLAAIVGGGAYYTLVWARRAPVISLPTLVDPMDVEVAPASSLPTVRFVDITAPSGVKFVHDNAAEGEKYLPETMGSGVAFLDYDGDGRQDLFFVNSSPWTASKGAKPPTQALYRNLGGGRFEDVTGPSGLGVTLFGMGATVGDVDNDGDPDLYVTALGGGHLFRNDAGKFTDITAESNARGADGWLTSAAFLDIENDGDLDLFICRYVDWSREVDKAVSTPITGAGLGYDRPSDYRGTSCILLRNDGGKFVDVTDEAGIRVQTPDLKSPVAKSLGVAPYDVNDDGLVDIAVANDTVQNFLFINRGGGKFEEVGIVSGVAFDGVGSARGGMGIDFAHFRNDPCLGLAIGNFANEMMAFYVADEPADARGALFSDQANVFGLGAPTQPPMKFGLFFFDYDLDGRLDLLSVNGHLEPEVESVQASERYKQSAQLYWNNGTGRRMFTLVPPDVVGPDLYKPLVGRGSAYADIDGDGDLDLVLTENGGPARLLRNDGATNKSLRLDLRGTTSNRSAIGAKVTVQAGGVTQIRQNYPAKGYLSAVELPLTFGLGKNDAADKVTITWPSGRKSELSKVAAGKTLVIEEPRP